MLTNDHIWLITLSSHRVPDRESCQCNGSDVISITGLSPAVPSGGNGMYGMPLTTFLFVIPFNWGRSFELNSVFLPFIAQQTQVFHVAVL